jgi:hypothetical protein
VFNEPIVMILCALAVPVAKAVHNNAATNAHQGLA